MMAVQQTSPTTFSMVHPPERMGNALPIAYGGFALAMAVKAASLTILESTSTQGPYHLYSILGNYLGPAKTDRPLLASVRTIRQTRTFATRFVEVSQKQDDGSERGCMVVLADFQVAEEGSLLVYSVKPSREYSHYSKIPDADVAAQELVTSGKVGQKLVDAQNASFGLSKALFQSKPCPEGIFAQNLMGVAKHLATTQDELPLTERSTADWVRSREKLPNATENVANLAFLMDGALAFAPLSFSHMFLDDSSATSSLEFALRLFSNEIDMAKWHSREIQTHVGAAGKMYTEGRLFDEEGRCVASMTQQSICRPKKSKTGKL